MKTIKITLLFICMSFYGIAQVGVGNTDPKATLDITASNTGTPSNDDGILIPRIDNFPTTNPGADQDGMMVFATGNGTPLKGFYYWDNTSTSWLSVTGVDTQNTLDQAYDESGAGAGKDITADNGAVTINGTDGLLVTGTYGSGNTIDDEITGDGMRMFFNPRKGALRAGFADRGRWDDVNIGDYSFSVGNDTQAGGNYAVAFGIESTANGNYSFSLGLDNDANGTYAFVGGNNSGAYGDRSFAYGNGIFARGDFSYAFGRSSTATNADYAFAFGEYSNSNAANSVTLGTQLNAESYAETVLGLYNTNYTENSSTTFDANDRLFVIGNGTSNTNRSNALTIFKNGRMNINDAYNLPTADGVSGQVLTTDGAGNITFQNAATGVERINDLIDGKSDNDGSQNGSSIFLGIDAGAQDNSTDNRNIAIGFNALSNNVGGNNNIAIGYNSLLNNTNGSGVNDGRNNIALGSNALESNTEGWGNLAIGTETLLNNVSGFRNLALGYQSLYNNTGNGNHALGYQALFNNTIGSGNVAIGQNTLFNNTQGQSNISIGFESLYNNTTGNNNTAVGFRSLHSNTEGFQNSALGYENLFNNTSGEYNSVIGFRGLYNNTTGNYNVANGYLTLYNNTSGNFNVALGYRTLYDNNGNNNVAIGYQAGENLTLGNNNIFIGTNAGSNISSGFNNRLYIDNISTDNPLIYGDFFSDFLRINGELQVSIPGSGGYSFPTTDGTNGQVLTTDGAGNISFENALTDADWHEASTSNNPNDINDDIFTQGNVGIGNTTPNATLDILYSGTQARGLNIDFTHANAGSGGYGLDITAESGDSGGIVGSSITIQNSNLSNSTIGVGIINTANGNDNSGITSTVSGNGNNNTGIWSSASGASQENIGGIFTASSAGLINTGIFATASGAGTNWAGYFGNAVGNGNVYVNDLLEVASAFRYTDGNETLGYILSTDANGDASWVDPASVFTNTDNQNIQNLSFNASNILTVGIENGTSQTVDLSSLNNSGTDNQQIDTFSFNGATNILTLEVEGDGQAAQTVNLSVLDNSGTDNQDIENLNLSLSNILTVGIEDGSFDTVDLSSLDQSADVTANNTAITNHIANDTDTVIGNEVITSATLSGTNLEITEAGSTTTVDLSSLSNNDADWYQVGTSSAPSNNTENIFTLGRVGIGNSFPGYDLDVSNTSTEMGAARINYTYTGTSSPARALWIESQGTGNNSHIYGAYIQAKDSPNSNLTTAVYGFNSGQATTNVGVDGLSTSTGGTNIGVRGRSNDASVANYGGYFFSDGAGPINYGVWASAHSATTNWAAYFGDTSIANSGNVYIQDNLHVDGTFNYTNGSEVNGYVLVTDASGNANWVDPTTLTTDSDNQQIDNFSFNNTTNVLTLEIEDDGQAAQTVDLSSLNPQKAIARITMSASQTETGGGTTKVSFDTRDFDVGGNFSLVNDNYVVPADGLYRVTTQITMAANTGTGSFGVRIRVGGTQQRRTEFNHRGSGTMVRQVTSILNLTAGDIIDVSFTRPGVGATIQADARASFFEIEQL